MMTGRVILFGLSVMALVGMHAVGAAANEPLLADQILALAPERYTPETLYQMVSLLEAELLGLDESAPESQAFVLNWLSQICYEATTFTDGDTSQDAEWFEKGRTYGLRSLRLNAQFAEQESRDFDFAVAGVVDAAALHWTASNWGKLCGLNPIQGLLQQGKVLALFSRCVAVDPSYWGASASSSLGSLLIMSPSAMGGDKEAGLALVQDSIATDPSYLSNRVVLAEYWGFTYGYFGQLTGVRDAELIERELAIVLEAEVAGWPFWNRVAKQDAQRLLERLRQMTD